MAAFDAEQDQEVEAKLIGVFELPTAGGEIAAGAPVYWDAAEGKVTVDFEDAPLIGAAVAGSTAGTIRVRLNGTFGVVSKDYVDDGDQ